MATLERSAIRQRIATAVGTLSGYSQSRWVPEHFGLDPSGLLHKSFAVAYGGGAPAPFSAGQRQRLSDGFRQASRFSVRVCYRLRGDAQISDYDSALDGLGLLQLTVMGVSMADLHIQIDGDTSPEVWRTGEWFLGRLNFLCYHRLPLT